MSGSTQRTITNVVFREGGAFKTDDGQFEHVPAQVSVYLKDGHAFHLNYTTPKRIPFNVSDRWVGHVLDAVVAAEMARSTTRQSEMRAIPKATPKPKDV